MRMRFPICFMTVLIGALGCHDERLARSVRTRDVMESEKLLSEGVDINSRDAEGRTALHVAIEIARDADVSGAARIVGRGAALLTSLAAVADHEFRAGVTGQALVPLRVAAGLGGGAASGVCMAAVGAGRPAYRRDAL